MYAVAENSSSHVVVSVEAGAQKNVTFRSQAHHDLPLEHVDSVVHIYRLLPDELNSGEILNSVILQPEKVLNPWTNLWVENSNGNYVGATSLDSGAYIASFRTSHIGTAVHANNHLDLANEDQGEFDQELIPAFSRVVEQRFTIPE